MKTLLVELYALIASLQIAISLRAPVDLRPIDVSTNNLTIVWTAIDEGVQEYLAIIAPLDDGETTEQIKYTRDLRVTWINLAPGKNYTVSVVAKAWNGSLGRPTALLVTTVPMPPLGVRASKFVNPVLSQYSVNGNQRMLFPVYGAVIIWEEPASGYFDGFDVVVSPPDGVIRPPVVFRGEETLPQIMQKRRISWDLVPGVLYNFTVRTISNSRISHGATIRERMSPEIPADIKMDELSPTEVTISWKKPHRGILDGFIVELDPMEGKIIEPEDLTKKQRTIKDLVPGTRYLVDVYSTSYGLLSFRSLHGQFMTPPASPVGPIMSSNTTPSSVTINWKRPIGHLDYYEVVFFPKLRNFIRLRQRIYNTSAYLKNLEPDTEYILLVYTVSNGIYSTALTERTITESLFTAAPIITTLSKLEYEKNSKSPETNTSDTTSSPPTESVSKRNHLNDVKIDPVHSIVSARTTTVQFNSVSPNTQPILSAGTLPAHHSIPNEAFTIKPFPHSLYYKHRVTTSLYQYQYKTTSTIKSTLPTTTSTLPYIFTPAVTTTLRAINTNNPKTEMKYTPTTLRASTEISTTPDFIEAKTSSSTTKVPPFVPSTHLYIPQSKETTTETLPKATVGITTTSTWKIPITKSQKTVPNVFTSSTTSAEVPFKTSYATKATTVLHTDKLPDNYVIARQSTTGKTIWTDRITDKAVIKPTFETNQPDKTKETTVSIPFTTVASYPTSTTLHQTESRTFATVPTGITDTVNIAPITSASTRTTMLTYPIIVNTTEKLDTFKEVTTLTESLNNTSSTTRQKPSTISMTLLSSHKVPGTTTDIYDKISTVPVHETSVFTNTTKSLGNLSTFAKNESKITTTVPSTQRYDSTTNQTFSTNRQEVSGTATEIYNKISTVPVHETSVFTNVTKSLDNLSTFAKNESKITTTVPSTQRYDSTTNQTFSTNRQEVSGTATEIYNKISTVPVHETSVFTNATKSLGNLSTFAKNESKITTTVPSTQRYDSTTNQTFSTNRQEVSGTATEIYNKISTVPVHETSVFTNVTKSLGNLSTFAKNESKITTTVPNTRRYDSTTNQSFSTDRSEFQTNLLVSTQSSSNNEVDVSSYLPFQITKKLGPIFTTDYVKNVTEHPVDAKSTYSVGLAVTDDSNIPTKSKTTTSVPNKTDSFSTTESTRILTTSSNIDITSTITTEKATTSTDTVQIVTSNTTAEPQTQTSFMDKSTISVLDATHASTYVAETTPDISKTTNSSSTIIISNGNNVISIKKGISTICKPNNITVMVDKAVIGQYEETLGPLHLNEATNPACKGIEHETYYRYTIAPNILDCGTQIELNETHVNFTNSVSNRLNRAWFLDSTANSSDSVMFRNRVSNLTKQFVHMRIWCTFPFDLNVTSEYPFLSQINKQILWFNVSGHGQFSAIMQLYKTDQYLEPYLLPPAISRNDSLYIGISLPDTEDQSTFVVVKKCWGTPERNPLHPQQYPVIENYCPIRDHLGGSIKVFGNGEGRRVKWEGTVFKFISYPEVWLHCEIKICFGDNCKPDCAKSKKRRSIDAGSSLHIISAGPIVMNKAKDASINPTSLRPNNDDQKSQELHFGENAALIIAIVLSAVITASVMIFTYFVVKLRRKRRGCFHKSLEAAMMSPVPQIVTDEFHKSDEDVDNFSDSRTAIDMSTFTTVAISGKT